MAWPRGRVLTKTVLGTALLAGSAFAQPATPASDLAILEAIASPSAAQLFPLGEAYAAAGQLFRKALAMEVDDPAWKADMEEFLARYNEPEVR